MSSKPRAPRLVKGPQLGDTTFEDWYETPIFEVDADERLEHLAVSRRAPVRLVGNAALRLSGRSRRPWRERAGQLLDTWAEREAMAGTRLEEMVVPKRWRS